MKNKYEDFYYSVNDLTYPTNVYWNLYNRNKKDAIKKYNGYMFCPLCHSARLTVASGNIRQYFKVVEADMNRHDDGCAYRLDEASKKETEEFYKDLDKSDIENRLVSCMNRMLKSKYETSHKYFPSGGDEKNDESDFFVIKEGVKKKYLPHKNLNTGEFDNNISAMKIYYGTCLLYLYRYPQDKNSEAKIYYLKILNPNTKNQICDISISLNVYKYLKNILATITKEKDNAQYYHICFSGKMMKQNNSYLCHLMDSRLIVLEKAKK